VGTLVAIAICGGVVIFIILKKKNKTKKGDITNE
jgi:hypothetical protein